jgi:hypothetical protein
MHHGLRTQLGENLELDCADLKCCGVFHSSPRSWLGHAPFALLADEYV